MPPTCRGIGRSGPAEPTSEAVDSSEVQVAECGVYSVASSVACLALLSLAAPFRC